MMMLGLDKIGTLLIGFYLCLHFHYCLTEQQQQSSVRNLHSQNDNNVNPSSPQKTLSSDTSSLRSSAKGNDSNDNGSENVIFNEDQFVYKCLGRVEESMEQNVEVPAQFMSDNVTHIFPLKRKELNCKRGRFKVLFQIESTEDNSSLSRETKSAIKVLKMDSKSRQTTSYDDASIRIMKDGAYLHVASDFFHPTEYCFDSMDPKTELSMFVCYPECHGQRPCVTKCCPQDEVWDVDNMRCRKAKLPRNNEKLQEIDQLASLKSTNNAQNSTLEFEPFDEENHSSEETTSTMLYPASHSPVWTPWLFSRSVDNCVKKVTDFHREQLSVHIQQRLPSCDPANYSIIPLRKLKNLAFQRFRVLWTGSVILRDKYGNWSEFEPGRYCVDGMVNFKSRHSKIGGPDVDYSGHFEDQLVLVCPDQMPVTIRKKPIPTIYAIMLLLAAIILFATALISFLQWDRQNVYEWTVSCEVISLLFLIIMVGIAHTIARRPEKSDFGSFHCVLVGAASHFFWLATFFWLFIINFEIWWNFRSLVQLRQTRKWFRFGMYQLVGWGGPLLIVGFGLLLDRIWGLQNEDIDCTDLIVPNYGQLNCYISKKAQGPYLFYPIGVILGCNLIFYLLTVCKMWRYQKKSQAIIQYRSKGQTQPTIIFAKLFIVMGVSWIFEVVAWAITITDADKVPLYWVIFDVVTLFQAGAFFAIFVWRKEVLTRLWYKFPSCQSFLYPFSKLPGCGIVPNDRERMTSLHQMNQQQHKCSQKNGKTTSTRFHHNPQYQPHQLNGMLPTVSGRISPSSPPPPLSSSSHDSSQQSLPLPPPPPPPSQTNIYSYSTNDVGNGDVVDTIAETNENNDQHYHHHHSNSNSSNSNNNVSFSPTVTHPRRMVVGSAEQIKMSSF